MVCWCTDISYFLLALSRKKVTLLKYWGKKNRKKKTLERVFKLFYWKECPMWPRSHHGHWHTLYLRHFVRHLSLLPLNHRKRKLHKFWDNFLIVIFFMELENQEGASNTIVDRWWWLFLFLFHKKGIIFALRI
jgi:hypothetical protein